MRGGALLAALLAAAPATAGAWLSSGPVAPRVELTDQDGRTLRFDQLMGERPVLVSFFFTACMRVCPPQTALMRDVQDELDRRGGPVRPLLLSVSLNPLSDTPESLRAYARLFDAKLGDREGWLMLTGGERALEPVWKSFDADGPDIDAHSGTLWIGRPAGSKWTRTSAAAPGATAARIADMLLEAP